LEDINELQAPSSSSCPFEARNAFQKAHKLQLAHCKYLRFKAYSVQVHLGLGLV